MIETDPRRLPKWFELSPRSSLVFEPPRDTETRSYIEERFHAMERDPRDRARAYYKSLDKEHYDRLGSLLAPQFEHRRPDRHFTDREQFLCFMRNERPRTNTRHSLETITEQNGVVTVTGSLKGAEGETLLSFRDRFEFDDRGRIRHLETFLQ